MLEGPSGREVVVTLPPSILELMFESTNLVTHSFELTRRAGHVAGGPRPSPHVVAAAKALETTIEPTSSLPQCLRSPPALVNCQIP